jgi:hypothetical protein
MIALDELAIQYKTDKSSLIHNYMPMYERLFKTVDIKSLLEIGLGDGASLAVWSEYLPEADIYCIELFGEENKSFWKKANGSNVPRAKIISGNSEEENTWKKVPFNLDIIIDDGSHVPDCQIATFLLGFSHLASKGLYFIEDVHASVLAENRKIFDWFYDFILRQQQAPALLAGVDWSFENSRNNMGSLVKDIYSYHVYKNVLVFEKY